MKCNYLAVSFHAKAINKRACDFRTLYRISRSGACVCDYEADEGTSAAVDFSEYKSQGKKTMYFGRALAGC